jgi:outer membrane protein insertion porin family
LFLLLLCFKNIFLKVFKHTYYLSICLVFILYACKQTKNVPENHYLLRKNNIEINGEKLNKDDINSVIRQQPNRKTLGIKLNLMAYNLIDSTKVAKKRHQVNIKIRKKNKSKKEKENRINQKRIDKAIRKNQEFYTEKIIPLKDTLEPKLFFKEWLKYKVGEGPVVFDTILFQRTIDQMGILMRKKGFYYSSISAEFKKTKRRKIDIKYIIHTGKPYIIDSVYQIGKNQTVLNIHNRYHRNKLNPSLVGERFDSDMLDNYRTKLSKFLRDETMYGFSQSHITFLADTNRNDFKVKLGIEFLDRAIRDPNNKDSIIFVRHQSTVVNNVHFHLVDTTFYKGNFRKKIQEMGLQLTENSFIRTVDTLHYNDIYFTKKEKKSRNIPKSKDSINSRRSAYFYYNGKPFLRPEILELQNYLEHQNTYKEYYIERSYTSLLQLDVFQSIKTDVVEIPNSNKVDFHYYLVPAKKQGYSIEPRFTNSNGLLGASATYSYTNKNLFRGSEKLNFSVGGGFESQPNVFGSNLDGSSNTNAGRSFNTLELEPSIKLDLPGLFPINVTALSKRHRPRTIISTAVNYQSREEFLRRIVQFNYTWRFYVGKKQIFQIGLPGMSSLKVVSIDPRPAFQAKLNETNDLFLRNAYSNQFIWEDWKLTYEYNNKADKKGLANVYFNTTFDLVGNLASLFKERQDTSANGQRMIFGVAYSQFVRIDNKFIFSYPFSNKKSINFRVDAGLGLPYGNTTTSLPFDYSFFGGGSNDNRGWRARTLGPGSYKYYLDPESTVTQIGDVRLGGSGEFRFHLGGKLHGAFFVDANNIWTVNKDEKRVGGQFSSTWYKDIAVASGVGLRFDLGFFIARLDLGIPIVNPALPEGARWIFQSRQPYYDEGIAVFGQNYKKMLPRPFMPIPHFGIGYPF